MWSMHIRLVGRDEDANPTLLWRKGGETHQAIWKHAESQGRAFPGWLFIAITYIFVSEGSRNVLLVPPSTPLVGQVPNLKSFLCVDELCTMKWHLASGWDQLLSHHRCKRSKEAEHRQSEMQKNNNKEIWCFFLPDINFLFITFLIVQLFESNKWFLVRNMYKRSWQPQKDYNWHIFTHLYCFKAAPVDYEPNEYVLCERGGVQWRADQNCHPTLSIPSALQSVSYI